MTGTLIITIFVSVVLGVLLWDRHWENRRLNDDMKHQKETNMELLKRIPSKDKAESTEMEPLSVEKIAEAIRFEGYFPEKDDDCVRFKVQGENYMVDASRLPLIFIVKGYSVDPNDWEMDLFRDAAHKMSDKIVMVKAAFSDDNRDLRFFIAARDRNYESFRTNLTSYVGILEDGQRVMNEEYNKMVDEKREAALNAHPVVPSHQQDKLLS